MSTTEVVYNSKPADVKIGEYTLLEIACQIAAIQKQENSMERILWFLRYVYVVGCGDGQAQGFREIDAIVAKAFSKVDVTVAAQATPAIFEALEKNNHA